MIKVGVIPNITRETVVNHLSQNIKGVPAVLDDATLLSISDVGKIKKAYKLGAMGTPPAPENQVHGDTHAREKWQLEAALLGAIALRGS